MLHKILERAALYRRVVLFLRWFRFCNLTPLHFEEMIFPCMFVMVSRSQPRSCKRQQNPLMTNFVNIINKQFGDRASQRGYSTLFINEGTQLHTLNSWPAHLLPCHLHWKGRNSSHKRSQLRHPGGSDTPESLHCPWEHLRWRGYNTS